MKAVSCVGWQIQVVLSVLPFTLLLCICAHTHTEPLTGQNISPPILLSTPGAYAPRPGGGGGGGGGPGAPGGWGGGGGGWGGGGGGRGGGDGGGGGGCWGVGGWGGVWARVVRGCG